MIKVLFVCMGNICRSPTAEGVFSHLVRQEDLDSRIEIDSAGTIGFHAGNPPDSRATAAARNRGIDLTGQRSRMVEADDFSHFDHIIAMDRDNEADLIARCPPEHRDKISLFLEFGGSNETEVPDPYYGGSNGFEHVLDLVEDASHGLLDHLRTKHGL